MELFALLTIDTYQNADLLLGLSVPVIGN